MSTPTQRMYVVFEAVAGLDAVPTGTPGWKGPHYVPWLLIGPRLGQHRHIPGVDGRDPVEKEFDELTVVQPLKINGRRDGDGNAHPDRLVGVYANHGYLTEHLFAYKGARGVTLHMPGGELWTGMATVEDWVCAPDPNSGGDYLVGDLEVKVHGGRLVEAGS